MQAEQSSEERQVGMVPVAPMNKAKAVHLASTYLGFELPLSMEPHLKLTHDGHEKLQPVKSEVKVAAASAVVAQPAPVQSSKPVKMKPFPKIPKSEKEDMLAGMAYVGFSVVPSKEKELFAPPRPVGKKPSRNLLLAETLLGMTLPMSFEKNVVIRRERKVKPKEEPQVKPQEAVASKPPAVAQSKQAAPAQPKPKLPEIIRNANKSTLFIETLLGFNVPLQMESQLHIAPKQSTGQKELTVKAMSSLNAASQVRPEEVRPNRESTEAFLAEVQRNEEKRAEAIAQQVEAEAGPTGPHIKHTKEEIIPDNKAPQEEEDDILAHDEAMLASTTSQATAVGLTSSAVSAPAGTADEPSFDRRESNVAALKSMYESKNK